MPRPLLERAMAVLVVIAGALLVVAGWKTLWFQCDDAYIAFRYVSNARFGWGFVWNPPPWRPVEGYTSFLWVLLLDFVWTTFGVSPDRAANPISLGCGLATFAIVAEWAWTLRLSPRLEPSRLLLFALIVFGVAANRTFLMWTTSGLETSLQTLILVVWMRLLMRAPETALHPGGELWALGLVSCASLMALVRPDGLLYCAITAGVLGVRLARAGREGWLHAADLACVWPFAAPMAHLLWRHATYGYWLPNTWYAKYVGAWPLGGTVFLGTFLLEYLLWIEVGMAVIGLVALARRGGRPSEGDGLAIVAVATVIAHFAVYTFDIGGDHFEWRIYHHLIPLSLLAFPWLADRAGLGRLATLATLGTMLGLGLWCPWASWVGSLGGRWGALPQWKAADHLPPGPLGWYGSAFDAGVAWLGGHYSADRWHVHVALVADIDELFPPREEGMSLDVTANPVFPDFAVGLSSWRLPRVAIVDRFGLNDLVVARSPRPHTSMWRRRIAHDRKPPPGYVDCFDPNVQIVGPRGARHLELLARDAPLTDGDVVACETGWLASVEGGPDAGKGR